MGNTTINGGKVIVNTLANLTGVEYGALGDASKVITLNNGATFQTGRTMMTDHLFKIGNEGTFNIPAGMSLQINTGLLGPSATVTKMGDGTLNLGAYNTISRLIIAKGTVNDSEADNLTQLPHPWNLASPHSTSCFEWLYNHQSRQYVVPMNCNGTFNADPRATIRHADGTGTFTVYDSWIRCTFKGDWSKFEGTLFPR
jgi:hypothetical protein